MKRINILKLICLVLLTALLAACSGEEAAVDEGPDSGNLSAARPETDYPETVRPEADHLESARPETDYPETDHPAAVYPETVYPADSGNVKPLGRTLFQDGLLWCAFSGTGAEFTFTGTKCEVVIQGDGMSRSEGGEGIYARVGIYVNGERVVDDMINEPEKRYTVFENSTAEETAVKIVKLSETAMSCFAVKEIVIEGDSIAPAPDGDLLIEFVGDSITCGYGVDDEDRNHHFSTETEDVTKTYAYKTAQMLNADYSMVSISGYGVISGYTNGDEKLSSQTIPQFYDKLGFSYGGFSDGRPQDYRWDFSVREPDVIIVNLGTNDESYCRGIAEREAEFRDGYVEFLKALRGNNPNAKIVCALGIMGDGLFGSVEQAVGQYSAESGDSNVTVFRFARQREADGFAADWHPTEATHTKAAGKLAEYLKTLLQ